MDDEKINLEIQKQFRMMPGQEKIVKDYYEQNPAAIDSLRGQIYEEKIINLIKSKIKIKLKFITLIIYLNHTYNKMNIFFHINYLNSFKYFC